MKLRIYSRLRKHDNGQREEWATPEADHRRRKPRSIATPYANPSFANNPSRPRITAGDALIRMVKASELCDLDDRTMLGLIYRLDVSA